MGSGTDMAPLPTSSPVLKFFLFCKEERQSGHHPPRQTKVTIVGKNDTYNRENLIGPFAVHQFVGPRPPPSH